MSPGGWWVCEVPDRKRWNLDGVLAKSDMLLLGVGDSPKVSISERKVGDDKHILLFLRLLEFIYFINYHFFEILDSIFNTSKNFIVISSRISEY